MHIPKYPKHPHNIHRTPIISSFIQKKKGQCSSLRAQNLALSRTEISTLSIYRINSTVNPQHILQQNLHVTNAVLAVEASGHSLREFTVSSVCICSAFCFHNLFSLATLWTVSSCWFSHMAKDTNYLFLVSFHRKLMTDQPFDTCRQQFWKLWRNHEEVWRICT